MGIGCSGEGPEESTNDGPEESTNDDLFEKKRFFGMLIKKSEFGFGSVLERSRTSVGFEWMWRELLGMRFGQKVLLIENKLIIDVKRSF